MVGGGGGLKLPRGCLEWEKGLLTFLFPWLGGGERCLGSKGLPLWTHGKPMAMLHASFLERTSIWDPGSREATLPGGDPSVKLCLCGKMINSSKSSSSFCSSAPPSSPYVRWGEKRLSQAEWVHYGNSRLV